MLNRLKIINEMLASTGTAPLTSNDVQHPFYLKANNKLNIVNEEIQGAGWWFNKAARTFRPTVSGEVVLPSATLHADPQDPDRNLVYREGKLYDLNAASFIIGAEVAVEFIELVTIESLPPTAGTYIRTKAVFDFYRDEDGNEPKLSNYRDAMARAFADFKREHLRNADVNFFNSVSHMQFKHGAGRQRNPL